MRTQDEPAEVVATSTARAAEKLATQNALAASLTIFLQTDRFKTEQPQDANSFTVDIPFSMACTPEIMRAVFSGLQAMGQSGYPYKKAGVIVSHITSGEIVQPDLFGAFSSTLDTRQGQLMFIVNALNRISGPDTLSFAIQSRERAWAMRQRRRSPRLTSRWNEILMISSCS